MGYWQEADQVIKQLPAELTAQGWDVLVLILFGSSANGHPTTKSDLDLLAVVANDSPVRQGRQKQHFSQEGLSPSIHIFPGKDLNHCFSCLFDQILQKSPSIDDCRLFVPQAFVFGVTEYIAVSDQVYQDWKSYAHTIIESYVAYFRPYSD